MKNFGINSRATVGLKTRCDELSNYLVQRYLMLYPGKSAPSFFTELCHHLILRDDKDIDDPKALVDLLLRSKDPVLPVLDQPVEPLVPLVVSTVFLLRAQSAERFREYERGWNYAVDAAYWCGLTQQARYVSLVQAEAAVVALSDRGRTAANGLHQPHRRTMEFAWKRARELCPEGGWRKRIDAAKAIRVEVIEYATSIKWTMASGNPVAQIARWLSNMPEASEYFPSRRTKAASAA